MVAWLGAVVAIGAYAFRKRTPDSAILLRVGVVNRPYPYVEQWSALMVSIVTKSTFGRTPPVEALSEGAHDAMITRAALPISVRQTACKIRDTNHSLPPEDSELNPMDHSFAFPIFRF
jgi:hypothetical protein